MFAVVAAATFAFSVFVAVSRVHVIVDEVVLNPEFATHVLVTEVVASLEKSKSLGKTI